MAVRREGPGVAKVLAAIKGLDGLEGKTGWFETNWYPDGGPPVAYVATIHEFGTPNGRPPARPFMRPAVQNYGAEWMAQLADGAKESLNGGRSPEQVLDWVVNLAASHVGNQINALPPLTNEQTIKRKGFATALVDTGTMLNSITGTVERTK